VNLYTLFVRTVSRRGRSGGLQASSNCWIKGQNYGDSNCYQNHCHKNHYHEERRCYERYYERDYERDYERCHEKSTLKSRTSSPTTEER